jgi:hypoxanthine phosphoribosyltransferase
MTINFNPPQVKAILEEPPKQVHVNWFDVEHLCSYIAGLAKIIQYDAVIGIGRGGLIPATIISHLLGKPLWTVKLQLRDATYDTGSFEDLELELYRFKWRSDDAAKTFLVVDDINDSGKTISFFKRYVNDIVHPHYDHTYKFDYAVLYERKSSAESADIVGESLRHQDWIVFPWELKCIDPPKPIATTSA